MAQAKLGKYLKAVNITYCSCSKYVEKNQWKPYKSIKELVSRKIKERFPRAKLSFEDFEFPERPKQEVKNEIIVKKKGKEHVVEVNLKLGKCILCEKEGTQYYEAILQVRSSNMEVLEKSVELLNQRVANLRHRGMFINKVKRMPEGYDLYVTSRKLAQSLGRELYDACGGVFKASPHLFSRNRQTSKNIYRLNVFVRLPGFEKGDILVTDDDRVLRVDKLGKNIKFLDLDKNGYVNIDYKKLKYHLLRPHQTYVSRVRPSLEVIDPLDYQSVAVKNRVKNKPELGSEVRVVVHKGAYLVE